MWAEPTMPDHTRPLERVIGPHLFQLWRLAIVGRNGLFPRMRAGRGCWIV
jgi:hypothetical protein